MKNFAKLAGSVAAMAVVGLAFQARADTTVIVGSGWQNDQVDATGTPSEGSDFDFTVTSGTEIFSLTDAFNVGDVYTVTVDSVSTSSTFTLDPTPFDNSTGPYAAYYGPAWTDSDYSHLQLTFGPGTYSLSVEGDCAGGCPAGFGYRLDSVAAPEPATWALMLAGFGVLGAAMRTTRRRADATA